jgi:3-dehydroquinate synthase class II
MIKNIHASGRYVQIQGSNSSTYVNAYSGQQGVGNMRYNTTNQQMEVYDGSNWVTLNMDNVSVGLNNEAESLLDWARKKRDEELAWQSLAKDNKAVKIALDNLEQARQQLDITTKLAREYETTN